MGRLYINGQEIEEGKWANNSSIGGDLEDLVLDIDGFQLIDLKNMDKWVAEINEEDAEAIGQLTRLDSDKYIGKKIRMMITVLGPAQKRGR